MKRALLKMFSHYKKGKLQTEEVDIQKFTRKHAAGLIAEALTQMIV